MERAINEEKKKVIKGLLEDDLTSLNMDEGEMEVYSLTMPLYVEKWRISISKFIKIFKFLVLIGI